MRKIKLKYLKKTAGETKYIPNGCKLHIKLDLSDGQILSDLMVGNSWVEYRSDSVIQIACATGKMTQKELFDTILIALDYYNIVDCDYNQKIIIIDGGKKNVK